MSTHKKNISKLQLALIKLEQIKENESTTRIISKPRDKR
jgi:hypothetical protein